MWDQSRRERHKTSAPGTFVPPSHSASRQGDARDWGGGGVGSSRILPVLWSGTYGQGPEQRLLPSNKLELDLAQHKATNTAMP